MQIFEVKNNLVKAIYDATQENLVLSGFVVVKDAIQSFIGQIIHLEANSQNNFVIIKLLFTFDSQGVISNYNGAVPDGNSVLELVNSQELLELLPVQDPILLGELAQQNIKFNLDRTFLENKLLVCCENQEDSTWFVKNVASQLINKGNKVLVFDMDGSFEFSHNRVIAGENFKLPLNYDSINFIYNGLEDVSSETKALIQEVFLEVQNYVKTLPEKFIPFETFKTVVDEQYDEMDIVELLLLKNKLLKYYEEGAFAQERSEFETLGVSLNSAEGTIFDLSGIDEQVQREMIAYAFSLINQSGQEVYAFLNLNNSNSDKKLLKQIFNCKNAYSTLICPYAYKYLNELKQLSKNSIFFTPIQQQNDFAIYNTFLNKLNPHEFVIYGKSTQHMPLIIKLEKIVESESEQIQESAEQISDVLVNPEENLLDEEIRKDVDEIFKTPRKERAQESLQEIVHDDFSEEDLDFIDDLGIVDENEFPQEIGIELEDIHEGPFETPEKYSNIDIEQKLEIVQPGMVEEEVYEEVSNESELEANFVDFREESINEEQIEEEIFGQENQEIANDEDEPTESFSDVLTQQAQEPPTVDILPASMSSTPIVPVYSADVEPRVQSDNLEQGDTVMHAKYGKGTVEKLISYGSKTLCSINFDNVGRRLLDPNLAELKKV